MHFFAFALATGIPLLVLILIRALDLYRTGAFSTVLWSVAWGAIAFMGAYHGNTAVYNAGLLADSGGVVRFVAPPVEEALKILVLLYLVGRKDFTYFVDGAIYGFAAGVGFAVAENYQYILSAPEVAVWTAIARVISTNLVHGSATALAGIGVGLSLFQPGRRRGLAILGGLAGAILLHGAYNNLVASILTRHVFIVAALVALVMVAIIVILIRHGLEQSRRDIEAHLGAADRVTREEARLVQRLGDVAELLEPVRQMFGDARAAQIQQLLLVQAQLGIQRAALEKLPGEPARQAAQERIRELSAQMQALRQSIGVYTMLAVRQIFPDNASPVWDLLERRIQQRVEAGPAAPGAGWANTLEQRLAGGPADDTPDI